MPRMKFIRLIPSTVLLLAALVGCTELRTKEPFGEIDPVAKSEQPQFTGTWYSPTTNREHWNKFTASIRDDGKTGSMVMENAEGETLTYELQFRKIDSGVIFYRPIDRPEEGWQFCWVGTAFNGSNDKKDAGDNTLVLCMPTGDAFIKLGLKVEKKTVATPPLGLPKKDDPGTYSINMLTESPDAITAKIKTVDYRTLMFPTFPIVLIRHDLMKLTDQASRQTLAK